MLCAADVLLSALGGIAAMKLCTDLVFDELSAIYQATCYGTDVNDLSLNPPLFLEAGQAIQRDSLYVCSADKFVPSGRMMNCLFVISGRPKGNLASVRNSVIVLEDRPPLPEVFNAIQRVFLRYGAWEDELRAILIDSGDVTQMIRVTSELMDECVGICNKELKIVSFHNPRPQTEVSFTHLSGDGVRMFLDSHPKNVSQRAPFIFQGDGSATYCLNIYKNDEYLGVLTLPDMYHELTRGRMLVFDHFYEYLYRAIDRLSIEEDSGLVNLKMVFRSLLAEEPVAEDDLRKVIQPRSGKTMWVCLAARLTEPMKKLPAEYFCKQIEASDEQVVAVESNGFIAMVLPVSDQTQVRNLDPSLVGVVQKLFGRAGASIAFNNLSNSRTYFRQAVAALRTAEMRGSAEPMAHFGDWSFEYILDSCTGEFTPKYLLPKELLELRNRDKGPGDVDYWDTLKRYLDNGMSASATARDLYIHRTTLQYRIDRIAQAIDLSSPAARLYTHFCIYLYESYEALLNGGTSSS